MGTIHYSNEEEDNNIVEQVEETTEAVTEVDETVEGVSEEVIG